MIKKALTALLCSISFCGVCLFAESQTSTLPKMKSGDPLSATLFVDLYKAVNPAVVNIFTTYLPKQRMARPPYRDPFFELFEQFMGPGGGMGGGQTMPQQSLGSGFIIREDGLIVTNNHVVEHADVIKVQVDENNKESYDAKLIGRDPRTDVALIKISAKKKFPFVRLGSSADVQVGEWVAAFGNPYGYGHSMSKGIISAVGREIDELNLNPFMQTDASINPGNSGGPLVNTQGLVIGVNTAIDARAQGIGFVIPIDNVKAVIPQLEKAGTIQRGFIGVELADIDEEGARSLNIKQTEGSLITQVVPGTPAQKAGLEPYDLVVGFDGKKITSTHDLRKAVLMTPVGHTVAIQVVRDGHPRSLKITIGTQEQVTAAAREHRRKSSGGQAAPFDLGFVVADYTNALAEEFHLPRMRKARPVIVAVQGDSEAGRSGLAPGDLILDVNRKAVSRAHDVISNLHKSSINILRVLKQDRVVLVSLRAP
jgi:serine protease Do